MRTERGDRRGERRGREGRSDRPRRRPRDEGDASARSTLARRSLRRTVGDDVLEPEQGVAVGATLEEAIAGALAILGAREDEVDVEILEEGRRGFFGIGRGRPFRVRVTWREDDEEVIEEELSPEESAEARAERTLGHPREGRRDRARRDEVRSARRAGHSARREELAPGRGERPREREPRGAAVRDSGAARPAPSERREPHAESPARARREGAAPPRREEAAPPRREPMEAPRRVEAERTVEPRGARAADPRWTRPGSYRPAREPAVAPARDESAAPPPRSVPLRPPESLSPAELRERARQVTEQLMREMGMEASVSAREHEGDVWIDVESDVDDALLIGRRGETRNAIQHIVQRLIGPRAEMAGSVIVDVNSYWQRRMARLADEARSLAEEAVATGREQRTEPLNAQERRVVHRALSDDARVRTESHGDGEVKRVSITRE